MSTQGIVIIAIAIVFVIYMAKLSVKNRKPAVQGEMRHDESILYFAWMCFSIGLAPIISFFTEPPDDIWVGLLLITPFGFWGFLYLLSAKYIYNDNCFEQTSWVSPSDVYSWRSLLCVEYDNGSRPGATQIQIAGYVLKFSHKDITIPNGAENLDDFLEFLTKRGIRVPEKN